MILSSSSSFDASLSQSAPLGSDVCTNNFSSLIHSRSSTVILSFLPLSLLQTGGRFVRQSTDRFARFAFELAAYTSHRSSIFDVSASLIGLTSPLLILFRLLIVGSLFFQLLHCNGSFIWFSYGIAIPCVDEEGFSVWFQIVSSTVENRVQIVGSGSRDDSLRMADVTRLRDFFFAIDCYRSASSCINSPSSCFSSMYSSVAAAAASAPVHQETRPSPLPAMLAVML